MVGFGRSIISGKRFLLRKTEVFLELKVWENNNSISRLIKHMKMYLND